MFVLHQVSRLEGQVSRYKSASENAEKVEDELKAEKRKLQREVPTVPPTLQLHSQDVVVLLTKVSPSGSDPAAALGAGQGG